MKKAVRICCFALGTALLLAALFLVLHNVAEDKKGGEQAELLLDDLKQEIPEEPEPETIQTAENYDLYAEYETETVPEMETTQINGNAYIGYIAIPALDVELPVLSEWSYPNLKLSPCRYVGNLYAGDLVLCAHNYSSHFGRIHELNSGDEIIFTDVKGKQYDYNVIGIEQHPGTAVEDIKFGNADDWDLTLFTCTLDGQSRVTVRAAREEA
jgi:sortase A